MRSILNVKLFSKCFQDFSLFAQEIVGRWRAPPAIQACAGGGKPA
jgi:hypothetical protein